MNRRLLSTLILGLWLLCSLLVAAQTGEGPLIILDVEGVINPLTARYVERTLELAEQRGARAVVLTLDTPGGLDGPMREIVQMLLQSPVPVIVYVAPPGARATSAGLFIALAADIVAMAPATHIGAAHPVPLGTEIGEVMEEKVTSDAAALIRSIATTRERNAEWAEDAVRKSLSLTANEALQEKVIDLIATDLDDLLRQASGRTLTKTQGTVTLRLEGAVLERYSMNLIERFFHVISEPNIAYLFLSLGTLFLLAELAEPGLSLPGIAGVVCLVIAFMALGSLPVNWAGVALLAVGIILFVVGILTDTEVVVTVAGLIPFVLGSLLLFSPLTPVSPATPTLRVSPWLIGGAALAIIGFSLIVLRALLVVSRMPPRSGAQRLIGSQGVASTDLTPEGQVRVALEDWSAVAITGVIHAGDPVKVVGVSGVRLQVVPVEAEEPIAQGDV